MLKGLWRLSWIETKVFLREPLGVVGSLGVPVLLYVVFGRVLGPGGSPAGAPTGASIDASTIALEGAPFNVAIMAALLIALGAVQSLVAIISIYREGGILKRLRATPLSPITILGSHVLVKLAFTVVSLGLLVLAGRRVFPGAMEVALLPFAGALLLGTLSILSLGFVLASLVPTARFAQPIGAAVLYPMVALSGLFFPVAELARPLRIVAQLLPTTHAVALMQGVWDGAAWATLWPHVGALVLLFAFFTALATRVFRWE